MNQDTLNEPAANYQASERRSEFAPLIDELYRERIIRARQTSPEEKFLAGEELFEWACSITLAGIRNENPRFSEEDCKRELDRRLKLREKMERAQ